MKKKESGQSLIEFALVLPILVIMIIIISELGYSFIIQQTITDGIKKVVLSSHFNVGKYTSTSNLLTAMKSDLQTFINTHNLPPADSLDLTLGNSNNYGTPVYITYTYRPGFRLIGIIPERISISSAQIVQTGFVKINNPTVSAITSI